MPARHTVAPKAVVACVGHSERSPGSGQFPHDFALVDSMPVDSMGQRNTLAFTT